MLLNFASFYSKAVIRFAGENEEEFKRFLGEEKTRPRDEDHFHGPRDDLIVRIRFADANSDRFAKFFEEMEIEDAIKGEEYCDAANEWRRRRGLPDLYLTTKNFFEGKYTPK